MSDWCTIESDPGVFTQLIETIGVKGVQVEDLYTLDDSITSDLQPIYGLIFLFKWVKGSKDTRVTCSPQEVYFAQQVVVNACATQALISVLLNSDQIELGTTLTEFKSVTNEFSPEMKGFAIGNQPLIKESHNSFARQEAFEMDSNPKGKSEDVFHFISYIPVNGRLYELDGLKSGPIDLGACTTENWISVASPIIQERMLSYTQAEIKFSLLAVVKNRIDLYNEKIEALKEEQLLLQAKLESFGGSESTEVTTLLQEIESVKEKIDHNLGLIAGETVKQSNWKAENIAKDIITFLSYLIFSKF